MSELGDLFARGELAMTILRVQLTLLLMVAAVAANRHLEWQCDHDDASPDEVSR